MRWPFARTRDGSGSARERSDWIDDAGWHAVLASQPFVARLDDVARDRLRRLCGGFVASKAFSGANGFVIGDAIVARIATQACLPVLELGLSAYPSFEEVIVYPSDFVVDREVVDADGVVHAWSEAVAGEAWDRGPVVLSWDAADRPTEAARRSPAFNVVIHEFVHKLDMGNGDVDGVPGFTRRSHPDLDPEHWRAVLARSLDDFDQRLQAVERSIPRHVDPESARADRYYAALPLDAYAANDEGEFFSVSSETFFVAPEALAEAYPDWYALLAAYYRQDPSRA